MNLLLLITNLISADTSLHNIKIQLQNDIEEIKKIKIKLSDGQCIVLNHKNGFTSTVNDLVYEFDQVTKMYKQQMYSVQLEKISQEQIIFYIGDSFFLKIKVETNEENVYTCKQILYEITGTDTQPHKIKDMTAYDIKVSVVKVNETETSSYTNEAKENKKNKFDDDNILHSDTDESSKVKDSNYNLFKTCLLQQLDKVELTIQEEQIIKNLIENTLSDVIKIQAFRDILNDEQKLQELKLSFLRYPQKEKGLNDILLKCHDISKKDQHYQYFVVAGICIGVILISFLIYLFLVKTKN